MNTEGSAQSGDGGKITGDLVHPFFSFLIQAGFVQQFRHFIAGKYNPLNVTLLLVILINILAFSVYQDLLSDF